MKQGIYEYMCIKTAEMKDGSTEELTGEKPFISGKTYMFEKRDRLFFCDKTEIGDRENHTWTRNKEFFRHFKLASTHKKEMIQKLDSEYNIIAAIM